MVNTKWAKNRGATLSLNTGFNLKNFETGLIDLQEACSQRINTSSEKDKSSTRKQPQMDCNVRA